MAGKHLYVWDGKTMVGRFDEKSNAVTFNYESSYSGMPISLSMPLSGDWNEDAPARFLFSRLPESSSGRAAMRRALQADTTSAFDLLPCTDTVGGLTYSRDESGPVARPPELYICRPGEIDARVHSISSHATDFWWPEGRPKVRFSLAGSQGKFSLSRLDERWYWPTGEVPSTHIFKPASPKFPESPLIENASMDLVAEIGMRTARHSVEKFADEYCYVTERFDREIVDGLPRRVRTEELFFALGLDDFDKYGSEVRDIVAEMRRVGIGEEPIYAWIEQVIANMSAGNCDAHMRNYSVFLDGTIEMTPLYDVLNTVFWADLDDAFAMMINELCMACREFHPSDWEVEARACGLDADRISSMAVETAKRAIESLDVVVPELPEEFRDRFANAVVEANSGMLGTSGQGAGAVALGLGRGIEKDLPELSDEER